MKDLKYLLAYTIPLSAYFSFSSTGIWTYSAVFYAFIILPVLDVIAGESTTNLDSDDAVKKNGMWIFNAMLYANVPIVFGLISFFFIQVDTQSYSIFELVGLLLSAGILLATNGINVAHELGHRRSLPERLMSKLLYMPCLYMHFFIEHNFGHHMNVATPKDGATARYNQTVYGFWFSSVTKQYRNAWRLQGELLKRQKRSFLSSKNDMLWYHIFQPAYLGLVWYFFSIETMLCAAAAGAIAFLFLESINYIEHYGLLRNKLESGRYERVQPHHSWNSNSHIGRIVLYELTRHSDHHFRSAKKYQVLNSHEESPTLPLGYPASILLSLVPPLWFRVMNPRVPAQMKPQLAHD
ncbi:MAG TPA: alkane 1-monooxygenase [Flavobacteriales bacterium]|nr:alkane 1-monooxygenase [Flavobacteriales bacterium]